MVLPLLIPIVAGAAAYGAATQDEAGDYTAGEGNRTIDAYQIWEQLTTGPGSQSLSEGQAAAGSLKSTYQQRVTTIEQLSSMMDSAWEGSAGDAAKSGAHPLKVWMADSGEKLQDSDRYLGEQLTAFTTANAKVQEVPKKPPESGFLNDITPWETDTDRAIEDYNTKAQANVDAFNAYFKSSQENAQGMPTYSDLRDGKFGDIDVEGGGKDGEDGRDGGKDGGGIDDNVGGGPYPGGPPPGGGFKPGQTPSIPIAEGSPPNIPGGPGGDGYRPGGPNVPGGPGGNYQRPDIPAANYPSPSWDDGTNSSSTAGYTPSIPSTDLPGTSGGFGPGGTGGFGPGGSGSGSGVGGAGGIGAAGGFGPGGSGGLGAGAGSGAAPGTGAGAGAGQGGVRGGAGGAGGGMGRGMGGMPMGMAGGGRGGQGSDDEEHQNKFLIEEDPNALFGSDELTAPPVIGE